MILDVVYNHLGPDGNYLTQFSAEYFTDRYENEWGKAFNFDGPCSGPVREFVAANAAYWVEEYHLDGLRLDATQQIFDASPVNIMAVLTDRLREAAGGRKVIVVAENEPQHTVLVRPRDRGGYGLDALWNDDFHHSRAGGCDRAAARLTTPTIRDGPRSSYRRSSTASFTRASAAPGSPSGAARRRATCARRSS